MLPVHDVGLSVRLRNMLPPCLPDQAFQASRFTFRLRYRYGDRLKPSTIVTDAFTSIVDVMTSLGLSRFLAVSGSAEMKQMTTTGRIFTAILKRTPVGHAIRDHDEGLKVVRQSNLEWTLAGCNILSDGPERGRYKISLVFPGGFKKIHPADVAAFLLKETEVPTFRNEVVGIWY